jgi:hypothetical protein
MCCVNYYALFGSDLREFSFARENAFCWKRSTYFKTARAKLDFYILGNCVKELNGK